MHRQNTDRRFSALALETLYFFSHSWHRVKTAACKWICPLLIFTIFRSCQSSSNAKDHYCCFIVVKQPLLVIINTQHLPWSSSSRAVVRCPSEAATIKAVRPCWSTMFTSTLWFSNSCTTWHKMETNSNFQSQTQTWRMCILLRRSL